MHPGISFRKGKSWFALVKIFRAKRSIFSTTLLQVKMEKKMEKKKKEPVSYDEVFLYLSDKKYSCSDDSRKRVIRSKAAGFITADGVLITRERNSIEPRRWIRDLETRMQILKSCDHGLEGGHFGRDKTRSKISARYYWQGLAKVILGIFSLARIFRPENLYWRSIILGRGLSFTNLNSSTDIACITIASNRSLICRETCMY